MKSNLKCNVKKTNQLPKDFSKQFLESISKDSYKNKQSKQIKMQNGNNAFVLPLFLISHQTLLNKDLLIGESLVNRNPLKSLEIASFYASLDEKNRRAFILLGNLLKKLKKHRDAIESFYYSAHLSKTQQDFNESNKLVDIEVKELQSEEPLLIPVCIWADSFLVHVPYNWFQLFFKGNDESLFQIFISNPIGYVPQNKVEMIMINEFFNEPDIRSFINKIKNMTQKSDMEKVFFLYKNMISPFFSIDKTSTIYGFCFDVNNDRILLYLKLAGEINNERYRNYHCWIVPKDSLKIDSNLFLLITCTSKHGNWMDTWASKIFEKTAKYDEEMVKKYKIQYNTKEEEREISSDEGNQIQYKIDKKGKLNLLLRIPLIAFTILAILLFIIYRWTRTLSTKIYIGDTKVHLLLDKVANDLVNNYEIVKAITKNHLI